MHLERRRKKWDALMRSYGLFTRDPYRFPPKSDKIKRYVRKGIPPEFRAVTLLVWSVVVKASHHTDRQTSEDVTVATNGHRLPKEAVVGEVKAQLVSIDVAVVARQCSNLLRLFCSVVFVVLLSPVLFDLLFIKRIHCHLLAIAIYLFYWLWLAVPIA